MAKGKRQKRAAQAQQPKRELPSYSGRRRTVQVLLGVAMVALIWRAVDRQIFETDFLQHEGEVRHLRVVEMPAHRGPIVDRNGEPLAISSLVESVWADPRRFRPNRRTLSLLGRALETDGELLRNRLSEYSNKSFVYLKRRVPPYVAERVRTLVREYKIKGVDLEPEYRRFYPDGEVFAHVLGFAGSDDRGQEGLELAYEDWLKGIPGAKRVIRDGHRRVVEDVESIRAPKPGKVLRLSLDRRLQFLAYRELKAAVVRHKARSGSIVMLDARTGEVLAMVNQPSYNPNGDRRSLGEKLRNRAMINVFEPGSTMKPFAVATALEQGGISPATVIDTTPGYFKVGRARVKDVRDYGPLDVAAIIRKSSNVGVSKIALDLAPQSLWRTYSHLGFGQVSATGFPGEVAGQLPPWQNWALIDQATLAFGYGLSVTPLQLAQAYGVLAADGVRYPVSLVTLEEPPVGERILSPATARALRTMLEAVVSSQGTAPAAAVPGYRVAGKTGTVKKAIAGGYAEDRYAAIFAGIAPVSDPRLVIVTVVDEPGAGQFYGGQVAAPLFSKVMAGALRLLNVAPDGQEPGLRLAAQGGGG